MKGADVLAAIESCLADSRDQVGELDEQLAEVDDQIESILREKSEAIVELAGHYLPAIDQEAVRKSHQDVQEQLKNVLARRNRELRRLGEQLDRLQPQLEAAEARTAELAVQLQADRAQLEQRLVQLDEAIQADDAMAELAEEATTARERLAQNEIRLEEIRKEADEKLPAYEASSLFQYLLERRYGESNYASRGFIRRMDRWVARLIDFARAKKGYEFLKVTPELMAAEIAKRKKANERLCKRLESIRDNHKEQLGVRAIEDRIAALESQYEQTLDVSESLQTQIEPVEEEFEKIENSQGPYYEEALTQLVEFLSQTHTSLLRQWAQNTQQPEDDEIVAQIEWLSDRVGRMRDQTPQLQSQRRKVSNRIRQLHYVVRSCRRSDVDSPRCSFPPEFDIQTLLEKYRDERIDQHDLLRRVREHREFEPTASERAANQVTKVLGHPTSQTIMQVAAAATGEVLRQLLSPRRR